MPAARTYKTDDGAVLEYERPDFAAEGVYDVYLGSEHIGRVQSGAHQRTWTGKANWRGRHRPTGATTSRGAATELLYRIVKTVVAEDAAMGLPIGPTAKARL